MRRLLVFLVLAGFAFGSATVKSPYDIETITAMALFATLFSFLLSAASFGAAFWAYRKKMTKEKGLLWPAITLILVLAGLALLIFSIFALLYYLAAAQLQAETQQLLAPV